MAVGITSYLANKLLDHAFRNVAYTPPTAIYMRGHTGDPGASGTANASAQTTRYATTWAAASSGAIALAANVELTLNASETLTHTSFWDASTGGNCLFTSQATVSKGGVSGDIIRLISQPVSFSPLAA